MMNSTITRMSLRTMVVTLLFCTLLPSTLACGPGRGGIRRRGARKLTPLVYKQHEPNFSERSLAASGLPEGLVDRTSEKFRQLVPNYNPDIIFKDEEATGADRLMTQRCKEKLNTLAISVMNQWPGVQLRVTEAWDEDFHHAEQSLHYEGRAVDLTTSDRDRTKYGLLARLAVESGFDWVYYESRAHIHASCKSEASHPSKNGGCFKGTSTVMTNTGTRKMMSELEVGDVVLTATNDGEFQFSPVILFLDRDPEMRRQFYVIQTEDGVTLTVTPSHLVYARVLSNEIEEDINEVTEKVADNFEAVFASRIREGDYILVQKNGRMIPSRVASIETKIFSGVYAPLTSSGNLVVDSALASCYAVLENQFVAHAAFVPFRLSHAVKSLFDFTSLFENNNSLNDRTVVSDISKSEDRTEGIHWYADVLYSLAEFVMPEKMSTR